MQRHLRVMSVHEIRQGILNGRGMEFLYFVCLLICVGGHLTICIITVDN